ncbi:hypothetical protein ACFL27_00010 [candidate division CSSED10-310 bacterium]|uniref:Glycosyltransferase RgtA/B/C/D-like domain-containing protein n=1 Tax=candidate division CSSED10-310 bacterium TaxID=2855610 RepID=A0ABV6YQS9_UNCC1
MKKSLGSLLLFILPFIMTLATVYIVRTNGLNWLGKNYYPVYPYLLSSLNLARMEGVPLFHHPGTTMQSTGAIILRVVHGLRILSEPNFQLDVLKNPEFYIRILNYTALGFNVLMLTTLGFVTFWYTKSITTAIILQLSPFIAGMEETFFITLPHFRPEAFLLFTSELFFIFLIVQNISNTKGPGKFSSDTFFVICFAVVSGFGLATKASFSPYLVIPLIILPKLRHRIKYLFGTVLSLIFFTLPLIKEYPQFLRGFFSQGPEKIIEPHLYLFNMWSLLVNNKLFSLFLFISIVILLISYGVEKIRKISSENLCFRLLWAVALSQLIGVMMVARYITGAGNYLLLPVLCLSGVSLILIEECLSSIGCELKIDVEWGDEASNSRQIIFSAGGIWLVIIITICCLFLVGKNKMITYSEYKTIENRQRLAVYHKAQEEYKNYAKIYYFGSSSPAYALFLGDLFNRKSNSKILEQMYPNVYFYDHSSGKISDCKNEIPVEQITSKHGEKIIFQGPVFKGDKILNLKLRDKLRGNKNQNRFETIYEIDVP